MRIQLNSPCTVFHSGWNNVLYDIVVIRTVTLNNFVNMMYFEAVKITTCRIVD